MQRSALVYVMFVVLSAASIAWADDNPPRSADPSTTDAPVQALEQPGLPAPAQQNAVEATPVFTPPTPPAQTVVQSLAPEEAEAILGERVASPDGKDIGRLVNVLVGANGQPQAAVIDFGGFMGVGHRKIAVHWSVLHFRPGDPKYKVMLEMTPDQIKAAPEFLNPNKAAPVVIPATLAPAAP